MQEVIPDDILKEFSRLIMCGTQFFDEQDQKGWTKEEKTAYKFAKRLIKKYA